MYTSLDMLKNVYTFGFVTQTVYAALIIMYNKKTISYVVNLRWTVILLSPRSNIRM